MPELGLPELLIILAILLLWSATVSTSASAMEKMAEEVRKAKSYKCVQIVQATDDHPAPGKPAVREMAYTVYWLAPGSARTEYSNSGWKGPGPEWIKSGL